MSRNQNHRLTTATLLAVAGSLCLPFASSYADTDLPIVDAHVHYSHDSVELTPPQRVIELMESANLKFALVSSSDDRGTQLISELAPELIVPGLRPYRRRGETGTWFTDEGALAYTEKLLETNRYASIGEFHLYGETADLPIPRRIVELAVEHNLILHAHSDADAVESLLAQDPTVRVLWAHAGFDDPETVSAMLSKHDRLWADLAFRSEVGSGGSLSNEWRELFMTHPERLMLGTDTYTPKRMYFVPEHAASARVWLATLPAEIAENIAWKNAYNLIMPIWQANRRAALESITAVAANTAQQPCVSAVENGGMAISDLPQTVLETRSSIEVSEPFSVVISVCGNNLQNASVTLDALMPAHGHGMNYAPEHRVLSQQEDFLQVAVDGVLLHMPGKWQWVVEHRNNNERMVNKHDFQIQ
jgi:hypothetical protein